MRRWSLFAATLIVLTMLFPSGSLLAKSTHQDKKKTSKVQSSSHTASSKSKSASAKSSGTKEKKNSHAVNNAQKAPAVKQTVKSKHKGKKRVAVEAPARPAAIPLPDSYKGEFGVNTKSAMVLDIQSGKVLFAQEPDLTIAPASLTKIMTLFLLNERLEKGLLKLDDQIPVSEDASHAGGSNMRLRAGEVVSLDELMKGIAVASANDGCIAVAQYLGKGDYQPFVEEMNRKAQELGMTNTHFFNPNGLPADGQVTTARDMGLLARAYLTRFPGMLNIHSMTEFTHNNRVRHNSNSLLGKVDGVDGLKTGFVCSSGFNIVVTAKRGGTRIVAVVLGARNRGIRAREATRLVEEGFKIEAAEHAAEPKHLAMNH